MGDLERMGEEGLIIERLNEHVGFFLQGARLLERGQSSFQRYEVWDTPQFGTLFRLDGCFMSSEADEFYYHENVVHVPAMAHACVRRALIIGGGDGGAAKELLKYASIEQIRLVELDACVVELARRHLSGVHCGALDDPRVELVIGDGFHHVTVEAAATGDAYDLIVLDLTDPGGPADALYREPFFEACSRLLSPGGVLSLHLGSPVFQPAQVRAVVDALRATFAVVSPYFLYIPLYGSLWGLATASASLDPAACQPHNLDQRVRERGVDGLKYYNGDIHRAQFVLPNNLRRLLGT